MYRKKTSRPASWNARRWYKLIAVLTVLMFLYVTEQVAIVSLERTIYQTITRAGEVEQEVARLRIEASNLRKSSRIKRIAMENLGLTVPEGLPRTLF